MPKSELESHYKEEHAPVPCDLCGKGISKEDLDDHKVRVTCSGCYMRAIVPNSQAMQIRFRGTLICDITGCEFSGSTKLILIF